MCICESCLVLQKCMLCIQKTTNTSSFCCRIELISASLALLQCMLTRLGRDSVEFGSKSGGLGQSSIIRVAWISIFLTPGLFDCDREFLFNCPCKYLPLLVRKTAGSYICLYVRRNQSTLFSVLSAVPMCSRRRYIRFDTK